MSEKRARAPEVDEHRQKRSRLDPAAPQQNGQHHDAHPAKPAVTTPAGLSALEKAKALLANKGSLLASNAAIRAQLQAIKERKALSASAQPSTSTQPSPGVSLVPGAVRAQPDGLKASTSEKQPEGRRLDQFIDPSLTDGSFRRLERRRREGFDFFKAGTFQKEAEQRRLKAAFGELGGRQQRDRQEGDRRTGKQDDELDANLVPLGERQPVLQKEDVLEPIPDIEWWDLPLLLSPEAGVGEDEGNLNEKKVTIYIEHPVPLEPPAEAALPPPMPLPLTTKERKKLRTQRRLEKEKEKQELIRQGLLEAPKPKLKLSTFYRSMGVEAAADPTAVEQQVRADQDARQQAHEDRNLANKLTPAERREKKIRKLTGAAEEAEAMHVSVYRVKDLSHPQNRFKVKVNAEELHMTGCIMITDSISVIVAEGAPRAQKKYGRLLLERMKWNPDAEDEDEDGSRPRESCTKVWSGTVKAATFDRVYLETCHTAGAARKYLEDRGVQQYWDLAVSDSRAG